MGISSKFSTAVAWACLGACASAPAQDQFAEERVDLDSYVLLAEIAWERQQLAGVGDATHAGE